MYHSTCNELQCSSPWWMKSIRYNTIQYNTPHHTTLHHTTLHLNTIQFKTRQDKTIHYTTLHYTTLHYTKLHYATQYMHVITLVDEEYPILTIVPLIFVDVPKAFTAFTELEMSSNTTKAKASLWSARLFMSMCSIVPNGLQVKEKRGKKWMGLDEGNERDEMKNWRDEWD